MFAINKNNHIRMTRGDTARFDIVVKNADDTVYTLDPEDVITFTVKASVGAASPVIVKTGQSITINPSDTASLANGEYVYDVDIHLANGDVNTIIPASKFVLTSEV